MKIKLKESDLSNMIRSTIKKVLSESNSEYLNINKLIDIAKRAGDIVVDAKYAIEELGTQYGNKIPINAVVDTLSEYDMTIADLYNEGNSSTQPYLTFSQNDANKVDRIFQDRKLQSSNFNYEIEENENGITFKFPTNDDREEAFNIIKKAVYNGILQIKGSNQPNYDWLHNDIFESNNRKVKITQTELSEMIRSVVIECKKNQKVNGVQQIGESLKKKRPRNN